MPTVVGKLTQEEMERLHPQQPQQVQAAPEPEPQVQYTEVGVMVLICTHDGAISWHATDFEQWHEPLAPSLREGQAIRATRDVCRRYINATAGQIAYGIADDDREAVVQRMMRKGLIKMHVFDVPRAAFER